MQDRVSECQIGEATVDDIVFDRAAGAGGIAVAAQGAARDLHDRGRSAGGPVVRVAPPCLRRVAHERAVQEQHRHVRVAAETVVRGLIDCAAGFLAAVIVEGAVADVDRGSGAVAAGMNGPATRVRPDRVVIAEDAAFHRQGHVVVVDTEDPNRAAIAAGLPTGSRGIGGKDAVSNRQRDTTPDPGATLDAATVQRRIATDDAAVEGDVASPIENGTALAYAGCGVAGQRATVQRQIAGLVVDPATIGAGHRVIIIQQAVVEREISAALVDAASRVIVAAIRNRDSRNSARASLDVEDAPEIPKATYDQEIRARSADRETLQKRNLGL